MARLQQLPPFVALLALAAACGSPPDQGELSEAELDTSTDDDLGVRLQQQDPDAAERLALRRIASERDQDERVTFHARRVEFDHRGRAHVRLEQRFGSLRVHGAEAIVHFSEDGSLTRVTDALVRGIDIDTIPRLSAREATELAVMETGGPGRMSDAPQTELLILRQDEDDHLAYRVEIRQLEPGADPAIPVLFIDAHTGAILNRYNNLKDVILADAEAATFDMQNGINYAAAVPADSSDLVANDAQVHAKQTLAFFSDWLGRDSFDGAGARVDSYVHFFVDYVNAFWDGQRLTFGDGDGVTAGPLTSLDIVSHEFGHGVTQYTANLIYQNESGALNEATSDIFAAATEAYVDGGVTADTWKVGEDAWTPGVAGDALRYMNNPTIDGWSRDHYSTRYQGGLDNGGVHWNSGIANLFFVLLAQGGDHPNPVHRLNTVDAIGLLPATQIWYAALVNEMTVTTNFAQAREATLTACLELFGLGATQCASVGDAWCEVGVGGASCSPANSCADHCDGQAPGGCFCDSLCWQFGDCCDDYAPECLEGALTCVGSCGEQSPGECWCHASCVEFGDCCPDYEQVCGG